MTEPDLAHLVGPALASALAAKGYDTLTPVQEAVLDEALEGRDLRITSQTGSGKTIAIGFAVRDLLDDLTAQYGGAARPRVLILAPTRELAKQVADELTWLYAPLRVRVAAVTGGAGYLDQKRRALVQSRRHRGHARPPARRARAREASTRRALAAVVLDEADSMLDLGFREDLDAILAMLPTERRSHLVSATFSRDVVSLADRFQRDPVHVEGTRLGEAHADIEHVVHLVEPRQRVDALINLLLADEDAKSLVFARTRADVARIAGELAEAGFVVRTLSGEMEQPERDRALAAFRQGGVQALVATDVAARGIDVRDIARVIQVEPPTDVETYTHRSGRTGRAGKQGTSVLFVAPSHYPAIARGPRAREDRAQRRADPAARSHPARAGREARRVARARGGRRDHRPARHLHRRANRQGRRGRELGGAAHREGGLARADEGARRPHHPRTSRRPSFPQQRGRDARPRPDARGQGCAPGAWRRAPSASAKPSQRGRGDGWVTFRVTGAATRRRRPSPAGRRVPARGHRGQRRGRHPRRGDYSLIDVARGVADGVRGRRGEARSSQSARCRSARANGPAARRRRHGPPPLPSVRSVRRVRVLRGPRLRIARRAPARVRGRAWSRGRDGLDLTGLGCVDASRRMGP